METKPVLNTTNRVEVTPEEPALSRDETKAAVPFLIRNFPTVVRSDRDPPIQGQAYGVMSFKMLDRPMQQGPHLVYGYFKLRGSDPTLDLAKMRTVEIVQKLDSVHRNYVHEVGTWTPIFADPEAAVRERIHISAAAGLEKISERLDRAKYDEKIRKDQQDAKELQDRINFVGKDYNSDPSSIEYYTQNMVGWRGQIQMRDELEKRLRDVNANIVKRRGILAYLDNHYPEHRQNDAWLVVYNKRLKEVGAPMQSISAAERKLYEETGTEEVEPDNITRPAPEEETDELPLSDTWQELDVRGQPIDRSDAKEDSPS